MSESQLVSACLTWLHLRKILAWRQQAGCVRIGKKGWMRLGFKGMSDIGGILPGGRYLAIEVKRPGNRLSPDQRKFQEDVQYRGGVAFTVWSAEQLGKEMEARGF